MIEKVIIFSYEDSPNAEKAIDETVKTARPRYSKHILLTTNEKKAQNLASKLHANYDVKVSVEKLPDDCAQDFERAYQETIHWLRRKVLKNLRPEQVVIDYTGGRRDISFGLLLAGWTLGITNCVRAISEFKGRASKCARVRRVESMTKPDRILLDQKYLMAKDAFARGNYETAWQILNDLGDNLMFLSLITPSFAQVLKMMYELFLRWDQFNHREAKNILEKICARKKMKKICQKVLSNYDAIQAHLGRICHAMNGDHAKIEWSFLADLLNNAERRYQQGRYDDAVARLYRSLEALAQAELARCGIDKNNVVLDQVPPGKAREFCQSLPTSNGKRRLALFGSFQLLSLLDDAEAAQLGKDFIDNKSLHQRLEARNQSILAHGIRPVKPGDYKSLREQVLEIIRHRYDEIDERMKEIAFPESIEETP